MLFLILVSCIVVFVIFASTSLRYEHFILSPSFWRDIRAYKAILGKNFKKPLPSYGYEKVHSDEYGTLWRIPTMRLMDIASIAPGSRVYWGPERSIIYSRRYMVEVLDPSTKDTYYLAVPAPSPLVSYAWHMSTYNDVGGSTKDWLKNGEWRSAKSAVAWTFGLSQAEYTPVVQT